MKSVLYATAGARLSVPAHPDLLVVSAAFWHREVPGDRHSNVGRWFSEWPGRVGAMSALLEAVVRELRGRLW
jgi:hypothetical protein